MKQFLILLDGMTGAGKTTTSNLLSDQLPRTAIVGMDKIKRFVSDFERGTRDNAIARDVTFEMAKKYLDLGLSVIVDQPFKSIDEISIYEDLSSEYSIPCHKFQLFTNPDVALERVTERQKEWEIKVPEERIRRNISLYKEKSDLGFEVIDTTNIKPEMVVKTILDKVQKVK